MIRLLPALCLVSACTQTHTACPEECPPETTFPPDRYSVNFIQLDGDCFERLYGTWIFEDSAIPLHCEALGEHDAACGSSGVFRCPILDANELQTGWTVIAFDVTYNGRTAYGGADVEVTDMDGVATCSGAYEVAYSPWRPYR
jgi:hypothetical protein